MVYNAFLISMPSHFFEVIIYARAHTYFYFSNKMDDYAETHWDTVHINSAFKIAFQGPVTHLSQYKYMQTCHKIYETIKY